jgi:hypothetical protein
VSDTLIQVPPYATPSAWRRFHRKAVITADHTVWVGALADDGYGRFHDPNYGDGYLVTSRRSDTVRVSRWIWWAWHGPIPARAVVMHTCDLPICVRLDHLQLGTQRENLLMAAGRERLVHIAGGIRLDHADRRGQVGQSQAIRDAVCLALADGITDPHELAAIVDRVITDGDRYADQLSLFDIA